MTSEEQRRAYQSFFIKAEAGQQFMKHLSELITTQHEKAENEPELSRDYVQRAKGVREVIQHIQSMSAERKVL